MDNLGVHRMVVVRAEKFRLNIQPVWNAIYSPWFNPIESAFSKVKRLYKKEKLRRLVAGIELDMEGMIRTASRNVTVDNCQSYIRSCFEFMR